MVNKISLKELRKTVERARQREKERREKIRLRRELFELKNPRLTAAARGLGKGTVRFTKSLQTVGGRMVDRQAKMSKSSKRRKSDDFGSNLDPMGMDSLF